MWPAKSFAPTSSSHDHETGALLKRFGDACRASSAATAGSTLLCLDELGYVGLDARGAELLFQIVTEREERASVATASNLPLSEWGQIISDPPPCRRHHRPAHLQRPHHRDRHRELPASHHEVISRAQEGPEDRAKSVERGGASGLTTDPIASRRKSRSRRRARGSQRRSSGSLSAFRSSSRSASVKPPPYAAILGDEALDQALDPSSPA